MAFQQNSHTSAPWWPASTCLFNESSASKNTAWITGYPMSHSSRSETNTRYGFWLSWSSSSSDQRMLCVRMMYYWLECFQNQMPAFFLEVAVTCNPDINASFACPSKTFFFPSCGPMIRRSGLNNGPGLKLSHAVQFDSMTYLKAKHRVSGSETYLCAKQRQRRLLQERSSHSAQSV